MGVLLTSGCTIYVHRGLPVGVLFSHFTSPGDFLYVPGKVKGDRRGESCGEIILGIPLGEATVRKAAYQAGIRKISHVDYRIFNILDFYAKYCIIVYGSS